MLTKSDTIKLLFVDDEISVLSSIKRMLSRRCKNWQVTVTTSPHEVLDILKHQDIDVLVSDIIMPEMQGDILLEKVSLEYPKVIRVALSAHAESSAVTNALAISHQYISKPFDTNAFIKLIQDTIKLRNKFINIELISKINNIDALPVMPEIYRKVMSALNNPNIGISSIANLISQDVSLSSKILQVINSAYFSMPRKITTAFVIKNPRQTPTGWP